jgi:hypothetical protein
MYRRHRISIYLPKRGQASLELVFALPFLMALVAMIFAVATAALTKTESAVKARDASWRERATHQGPSPLQVFSTKPNQDVGVIKKPVTTTSSLPPIMDAAFKKANLISATAVSSNPVLTGTWNESYGKTPFLVPHRSLAKSIADDVKSKAGQLFVAGGMSPPASSSAQFRFASFEGTSDKTTGDSLQPMDSMDLSNKLKNELETFKNEIDFSDVSRLALDQFGPKIAQTNFQGIQGEAAKILGSVTAIENKIRGQLNSANEFMDYDEAKKFIDAFEDIREDLKEIKELLETLKPTLRNPLPNPFPVAKRIASINQNALKKHMKINISMFEMLFNQVLSQIRGEFRSWISKINQARNLSQQPSRQLKMLGSP